MLEDRGVAVREEAALELVGAMSLENDLRIPPPLPPGVEDQVQVISTGS